eukprot:CAMPEP_0183703546 /NCGR_PEP_ID=MMETSP0737-20130205/1248_1 /TAXON_ID=385413 /ORGANISM="Thalassiosira miniscula, Strain CCMP1093" /LENGTH=510 /DNA_ID=CAMNT_0025930317 /DNA_START=65 /DNA_END=1597 /DNA_ORIENTATION=-
MTTTSSDTKDRRNSENIGEGKVRRSISIRLIRHGESQNNQVYRDARRIYKGGTPEFDLQGWLKYVDDRRSADPGLSDIGKIQAKKLAEYLKPHLVNQASRPVRIVVSPMRRTIETILPTLEALNGNDGGSGDEGACSVMINGFYHESEGCHTREKVEPGMNAAQINTSLLHGAGVKNASFVGFQKGEENGWWAHKNGPETRPESEERAAKFYVWMMEYLDQQLIEAAEQEVHDIYDAGVTLPGEEHEQCHDRFGPRTRRRRTAIFIGHGDFMSLVLKRIIAGFGHAVEKESVPHRSAFVHFNTGITELEYFGDGRFMMMSQNHVPHLSDPDGSCYITGGSLKDGWSYVMPYDGSLDAEVSIAFSDEVQPHVQEQTEALRSLYLPNKESASNDNETNKSSNDNGTELTVMVKRGLQVVGCASLNEKTGRLSDVVVRPSAQRSQVGRSLIDAVKKHAKQANIGKIVTQPNTPDQKEFFEKMGFCLVGDDGTESSEKSDGLYSSEIFRMECKL